MVKTPKHRQALNSLLMFTPFACRQSYHMHPQIERSRRVCRFCKTEVEAPEHALSACKMSLHLGPSFGKPLRLCTKLTLSHG
ncbi:hypothetical protein C8J57DRAFT_1080485 [Mycena rebaudengoi]|nr:hypothetical protein C8J57DRAFT_1080485 [Mycena rebaudengoi]